MKNLYKKRKLYRYANTTFRIRVQAFRKRLHTG